MCPQMYPQRCGTKAANYTMPGPVGTRASTTASSQLRPCCHRCGVVSPSVARYWWMLTCILTMRCISASCRSTVVSWIKRRSWIGSDLLFPQPVRWFSVGPPAVYLEARIPLIPSPVKCGGMRDAGSIALAAESVIRIDLTS